MTAWNLIGGGAGLLILAALVLAVVQFFRGRLDVTPFIETLLFGGGALLYAVTVFLRPSAASDAIANVVLVWMLAYFFGWGLLLKKRVRQHELERAVERAAASREQSAV